MQSYNKVIEVGVLVSDPRKFEADSEHEVCFFNLAVDNSFRRPSGAMAVEYHYFDVVCFGNQAKTCLESLKKGDTVLVEGRLRWCKRMCGCGKRHDKVSIKADKVLFQGRRVIGTTEATATPEKAEA